MKRRLLYTLALLFASMQTFAQTYTYDNLNRLTKVVYSNGTIVTYTFDALGNRTSKKVTGATSESYTISTSVTPAGSGAVTGGGTYAIGNTIELKANAYTGFEFEKWSDGVTDNPRTITVDKDMSFTAEFTKTDENEDTDISRYENTVYIESTEASLGSMINLSVKMKNTVQAKGFGFDLYLPDGIDFVLDTDGFPETSLSTARTTSRKTNTFDSRILSDGSLRVYATSTNGSAISGNDGEVVLVTAKVANDMNLGVYPLILRNIAIYDINSQSYETDIIKTSIFIKESDTGIDSPTVTSVTKTNGAIYNLQGQRVKTSTKGIYIINGEKVIIK